MADAWKQTRQAQQLILPDPLLQSSAEERARTGVDTDIDFWLVSHKEIQVFTDQELGSGAWGRVVKGQFRGQEVAVKTIHTDLDSPYAISLAHREISLMAKGRHPNLLLFIAAALDTPTSRPVILTEVMDKSLRSAYKDHTLSTPVKVSIMRDVAAALNYLHLLKEPIIHRDVSSANVLLLALPHNCWRAKLSDFGSANLARLSVTAAPEVPRSSASAKVQQFPSLDVYSYGVLLCEVFSSKFPLDFPALLQSLAGAHPKIHQLVTFCIEQDPIKRPSMTYVLEQLTLD